MCVRKKNVSWEKKNVSWECKLGNVSWECELGNVSWEKCELALYQIIPTGIK